MEQREKDSSAHVSKEDSMTLRINTNISAMDTHRQLANIDLNVSKSLQKLSSGLRINRAADDAAGLSISETLRAQVKGLAQANNNTQDAISLLNTADGALNEISSVLQRMRELAVQSANGTLTTADHQATDTEFQQLKSEIDNIASYTTFNSYQLLQAATTTFTFQVGANNGQTVVSAISGTSSGALTLTASKTDTQANAVAALTTLDTAITAVNAIRSKVGAQTNSLEHTINSISISQVNIAAAESRIRDTDMASEISNLTKFQILNQSSTSMLAQANAGPQSILALFR
jgi:flagellin